MNWLDKMKQLFRLDRFGVTPPDGYSPEELHRLAQALDNTLPHEVSCAEVFQLLDQAAELAARGADISTLMPLFNHHIQMCHDCREEYEALLNVLQAGMA